MLHGVGSRLLAAVIREDPDVVVALRGSPGGPPDAADRVVDPFERPVREARRGPPAMALLVVPDEIQIDHGQSAGRVDHRADRRKLPHQDGNADARGDELDFSPQVLPGDQPPDDIHESQDKLDAQEHRDAKKAVDAEQQNDEEPQRISGSKQVVKPHGRGAEMSLRRSAGVDARVGAAAGKQRRALSLQPFVHVLGDARLEHADDHLAGTVVEAERRHGTFHAVEKLGRHRRRARRQPAVQRVEPILVFSQKLGEEREPAFGHRDFHLPAGEPVDLDQDQPRLTGHALRSWSDAGAGSAIRFG